MRERNRARGAPVPPRSSPRSSARRRRCREALRGEGSRASHAAAPVEPVPPAFLRAPAAAARQAAASAAARVRAADLALRLGGTATAETLADVARAAEEAGFTSSG